MDEEEIVCPFGVESPTFEVNLLETGGCLFVCLFILLKSLV